jgi:exosome complex component RRP42
VVWKPVQVTVCKLGDKFLLDPCLEEEQVIDTKLSVCVRDDDTICSLQKQGMGFFKPSEVEDAVGLAIKKCKELRKLVD